MDEDQELLTNNNFGIPGITRPFGPNFKKFVLPKENVTEMPVDPQLVNESCVFKVVSSSIMGGVMGIGMGIFLGSFEGMSPPPLMPGKMEPPEYPVKEQMRQVYRGMVVKSKGWAKSFFFITGIFSGIECIIEKQRAEHDRINGPAAGCVAGAAMSAKSGPAAACLGCAGFATFSAVVEHFMGH